MTPVQGSFFVTGTDTGVGKTFCAAALLAAERAAGIDAVPMKPVQTGCQRTAEGFRVPDLDFCLSASGLAPAPEEMLLMCPYCFEPACSPHLAAALAEQTISIDAVVAAFGELRRGHEAVIVEGAGGILVPVSGELTMLDIMKALALPVVLAARPGLGTINHTLLSLGQLRSAGLRTEAIVFVESRKDDWGEIEKDNFRTIGRLSGIPMYRLPFVDNLSSPDLKTRFRELACASLDGIFPRR